MTISLRRVGAAAAYLAAFVVFAAVAYSVLTGSKGSVARVAPGSGIPKDLKPDGGVSAPRPPATGVAASAVRGEEAHGLVLGVAGAQRPASTVPNLSRPLVRDEDLPSKR